MKNFLFISLLILNLTPSFSQSNSNKFEWSFNSGGGYTNIRTLHYNSAGDLIVMETIADTAQFGDIVLGAPKQGSYNGTVTFIGKRSQAGVYTVLVKHVSNQFGATFEDFALDSEDNIIVTGNQTSATAPFDYGNGVTLSGKGYFITKYNAAGQAKWAKLYNLNTTFNAVNRPISLGILPNNDIYFAAQSPNGNKPFWLVKLDPQGTEVWHKELLLKFQGTVPAIFSSANNSFFDNQGTAYFYVPILNGNYLKVNEDSLVGNPGTHPSTVYLLSIDGSGNKKLYGAYRGGIGDFCVEKETGNIILKYSQINANPAPFNTLNTINTGGSNQYLGLVALDKNLNYVKSSSASLLAAADVKALYTLGNLQVAGSITTAPGATITAGAQTFTTAAGKYTPTWKFFDADLNFKSFVAHPELSGRASEAAMYMASYNNKLAVAGSYPLEGNPTVNVNGTTLVACFKNLNYGAKYPLFASLAGDIFISQLNLDNVVTFTTKSTDDKASFRIYPNPASDVLYIQSNTTGKEVTFELYNAIGSMVLNEKVNSMNIKVQISHLPKGLYTSKLTSDGVVVSTSKVVVE